MPRVSFHQCSSRPVALPCVVSTPKTTSRSQKTGTMPANMPRHQLTGREKRTPGQRGSKGPGPHCLFRKVLEVATPHFHLHLVDEIFIKHQGRLGNVAFHVVAGCPEKSWGSHYQAEKGEANHGLCCGEWFEPGSAPTEPANFLSPWAQWSKYPYQILVVRVTEIGGPTQTSMSQPHAPSQPLHRGQCWVVGDFSPAVSNTALWTPCFSGPGWWLPWAFIPGAQLRYQSSPLGPLPGILPPNLSSSASLSP